MTKDLLARLAGAATYLRKFAAKLAAMLFVIGILLCGTVPIYGAQEEAEAESATRSTNDNEADSEAIDEITVRGERSLVAIERQMQRADQKLYGISNKLIDDPLYKVFCLRESTAGSKIKKRVCRPGFERNLAADAWEDEKTMGRQGGNRFTFDYKLPEAELRKHREIFKQKLTELAATNPDLAEAILTRAKLQRDYQETRQRQLQQ